MKQKGKKLLVVLLAMMITLTMMPTMAFADDAGGTENTKPALKSIDVEGSGKQIEVTSFELDSGDETGKTYNLAFKGEGSIKFKTETESAEDSVWCVSVPKGEKLPLYSIYPTKNMTFSMSNTFEYPIYIVVGQKTPTVTKGADSEKQTLELHENVNTVYTVNPVQTPKLAGFSVGGYTLNPAFDANIKKYTATVPYGTTSVSIMAQSTPAPESFSKVYVNDATEPGATIDLTSAFGGTVSLKDSDWNNDGQLTLRVVPGITKDKLDGEKVTNEDDGYTITLQRENAPIITKQPASASYVTGNQAKALSVEVSSSGAAYQWYKNSTDSNENGTLIQDATEASFTPVLPTVEKTTRSTKDYYYCVITNTIDAQAYSTSSAVATITTKPDFKVTIVDEKGEEVTACTYADTETPPTFSAKYDKTVDDGKGQWSYEWTTPMIALENNTAESLTLPAVTSHKKVQYTCKVTHTIDGVAESFQGTVTVKTHYKTPDKPVVMQNPKSAEYCVGDSIGYQNYLSAYVQGQRTYPSALPGAQPPIKYSYQWQKSTDGTHFTDIEGATSVQYKPPTDTAGVTDYRLMGKSVYTNYDNEVYTSEPVYTETARITVKEPEVVFEGTGTATDPYLLKSAAELKLLSDETAKGQGFKETYFKVTADITLPADWKPIGDLTQKISGNKLQYTGTKFSGTIDGNDKTITFADNSQPLIGGVNGAAVKNLNIKGKIKGYGLIDDYTTDSSVTIDQVTIKSGSKILKSGFIGGFGNVAGEITNCKVEENVVIGDDGTWGDLGNTEYPFDLVGTVNHQDNIGSFAGAWSGTITNCVSYAAVYGRNNVGGIMGFKGQSMRDCYINNCAFYGDIVASGTMVGGILGNGYTSNSAPATSAASIENCYAAGTIEAADKVGGVFGGEGGVKCTWNNGTGRVRNNYFSGTVKATAGNCVGGVIGYMSSLGRYNMVENNYYVEGRGATKGIGTVNSVLTDDHWGRFDAPTEADSSKLTKPVSSSALADGTLVNFLNDSKCGNNWTQGGSYPVISRDNHITGVTSQSAGYNNYLTPSDCLETNPEQRINAVDGYAALKARKILVKYSDGAIAVKSASEGTFSGLDFTKAGYQMATLTYGGYELSFGVNVQNPVEEVQDCLLDELTVKSNGTVLKNLERPDYFTYTLSAVANCEEVDVFPTGKEGVRVTVNDTAVANGTSAKVKLKEAGTDTVVKIVAVKDGKTEETTLTIHRAAYTDAKEETKVTFRLIGATKSKSGNYDIGAGVKDSEYQTWISTKTYTVPKNSTVKDVFEKACRDAGLSWDNPSGNYVTGITAPKVYGGYKLSEFTNGVHSGWMYTVNGKHIDCGLSEYVLGDNDKIIWHYVNDYSYEVSDWFDEPGHPSLGNAATWDPWLKCADVEPSVSDEEEQGPSVSTDVNASIKDSEASASVDKSNIDKLIDAVNKASDGSSVININIKGADKADKITVSLPKNAVSDIASNTDASLQLNTAAGNVTLDKKTMNEALKAASGDTLQIVLEKKIASDGQKALLGADALITEVTILSGDKEITTFGTAKLQLALPISDKLKDKTLAAAYIDGDGKLAKMAGKVATLDGKHFYRLETGHLSQFVISEESVIDAAIKAQGDDNEDQNAKLIEGVKATAIKAKSKAGKGWIKVTWIKSKGYKVDGYEVYRSKKKSSGYGTKAYFKTKKTSYKNTKGLKKGTRYYYKVRGYRTIDGKKVYTKWSTKAYRTAK